MRPISFFPLCCLIGLVPFDWGLAQPAGLEQPAVNAGTIAPSPLPPIPKSPIDSFRELLAMDESRRERLLAEKPPQARRSIEAKLKEYLLLPAKDRELRLKLVELQWYLTPLMKLPPAQRAASLAMVPAGDRPLIEDRLNQWDQLSPELQNEMLTNQMTIHYFLRLQGSTPAEREAVLRALPDAHRQKLEAALAQWRQVPESQRLRMLSHFKQFLELDDKEKEKVLRRFSESERQSMDKTLQVFQKLTKDQQMACIAGFHKFSNLPPEKRQQFRQNAERWQEMSLADRQAWRDLVRKMPELPPLPPGLKWPPLPPGFNSGSTPLAASNNVASPVN